MSKFIENTIDVDGTNREYYIHHPDTLKGVIPEVVAPHTKHAVIMAFHGGTSDINRDMMVNSWDCVASHDTFQDEVIVICPKAEFMEDTNQYQWQSATPQTEKLPLRDLKFVEALLDLYKADPVNTYGTGFSSGAGMTWQLTYLDRTIDRFAGFAMVSQSATYRKEELGDATAMGKAKPIMYIHGTADNNWVRANEVQEEYEVDKMPPDMMRDLIVRNNSNSTPEHVKVLGIDRDMAAVEQLFLPNMDEQTPFSFITILNTGNNWPRTGGTPPLRITTFSATVAIFNFWERHAGLRKGQTREILKLSDC